VRKRCQEARKNVYTTNKEPPSTNSFDILQQLPEDMDELQLPPQGITTHNNAKDNPSNTLVLE
jgi:hypothetical protein